MNPEVLIIGCGFLGEAVAELFSARGRRVMGLVRSPESRDALAGRPFEAALCDLTDPVSVEALTPRLHGVPIAIHAVSAGHGGEEAYGAVYRDGLRLILEKWRPGRVIFVSSTSVYGQNNGSWVTEESPTFPDRKTGLVLLEAEAIALAAGGSVARLSGLYGPGRSALLRKFLSEEAVLEEGSTRWINQIHRDDAAAALLRLADPAVGACVTNVSDDTPATQREVYGWIASFLKRPLPAEGPVDLNRKRGLSSKRVNNTKLHTLGWNPEFPSYRDALTRLVFKDGTFIPE